MNLIKKILSPLIIIILVYTISIYWHDISLPFDNENNIIGEYSENYHNVNNDTLRFIFFVFFPIIFFLISYLSIKNEKVKTFKEILFENKNDIFFLKKNKIKTIYLFIFLIIIFLDL